ncbi:hypothetical protein HPB48_007716 [Haemaphysalis longicornis]|uniref:Replication factor C C-terminal domain-containing protein n=1 Tax=Haemaphysalis longicornis TaxID=44386 RepID=A0A9J6G3C4_HAELO|nr:hypothetical protein HPB48_007716 [Haemaphysalis longicornis]
MASFLLVLKDLVLEGFAASQLFNQLHDAIVLSSKYNDQQKSAIAEKLAVSVTSTLVALGCAELVPAGEVSINEFHIAVLSSSLIEDKSS